MRIIRTGLIGLALSWVLGAWAGFGRAVDDSVRPGKTDNFLKAEFRLMVPDRLPAPEVVLVFIPGTDGDGREMVDNPGLLELCRACRAAFLGCHYEGQGLDYDRVDGGSGRALEEALPRLAAQLGRPGLAKLPLLLLGYSQGGNFAFNYSRWRPERVKAFAALKYVVPAVVPEPSFQVPGLLVAGERDEPGRIRLIARTFAEAKGKNAKWAFLLERNEGHDIDGKLVDFVQAFFHGVCQPATDKDSPVFLDPETGAAASPDAKAAGLCWLPDEQAAAEWKSLHQPSSLHALVSMPERPSLQNLLSITGDLKSFACENGRSQSRILTLTSDEPGVVIDRVSVSGEGFRLEGTPRGTLPLQVKIHFEPRNAAWGRVGADVVISGFRNGQLLEPVSLPIPGLVKGPIIPSPSMVYLGTTSPGQATDRTIVLTEDHPVPVSRIDAPDGVTAVLDAPGGKGGDSHLRIHWVGGSQLGDMNGEIRLSVDSPTEGVLRIPVFGLVLGKPSSTPDP